MTTVAWRNGVLAADTLVTERDRRVGFTRKAGKVGSVLWGASGCLMHTHAIYDWLKGGAQGDPPSMETPKGATSQAMLIAAGRLLCVDEHGWDHMPAPEFYAIGSGAPYALGAMAAGASAYQAVQAAARLDLYTGGDILVFRA